MSKKVLTISLCLILTAAVLVFGIWILNNLSTERPATQAEIEAHSEYLVDWSRVSCWQEGMTEQELILSLCTEQAEEDGVRYYTSDTLKEMLCNCKTVEEISLSDGILTIHYQTADNKQVTLRYPDGANVRLWVWNREKDALYTQTEDGATVTANYYQSLRQRVQ